jgi:hypothetical protein
MASSFIGVTLAFIVFLHLRELTFFVSVDALLTLLLGNTIRLMRGDQWLFFLLQWAIRAARPHRIIARRLRRASPRSRTLRRSSRVVRPSLCLIVSTRLRLMMMHLIGHSALEPVVLFLFSVDDPSQLLAFSRLALESLIQSIRFAMGSIDRDGGIMLAITILFVWCLRKVGISFLSPPTFFFSPFAKNLITALDSIFKKNLRFFPAWRSPESRMGTADMRCR